MNQQQETPKYFWKDGTGQYLDMMKMDIRHFQYAHTHACGQEFKYHQLYNFFSEKREQFEEIAKTRKIKLIYPDEKYPSDKWKDFFHFMRYVKEKVVPTCAKRPSIENFKGLEQIHVLD